MGLSPMMQQYLKVKDKYKDTIVFYRLGDFYEMFFDDAITVSRELDLTLTGRNCGLEERAPMCGVPYHSAENYIAKLLAKGYKVAICEQVTKPGDQKGLVVRNIVREVTPGTKTDESMLDERSNNYLVSVYLSNNVVGVSWTDITTGEFNNMQIDAQISLNLNELLSRIEPSEIICNGEMLARSIELSVVKYGGVCKFSQYKEEAFENEIALSIIKENNVNLAIFEGKPACISSAGALLLYVKETQKKTLPHMSHATIENNDEYMGLDSSARRTLELMQTSGGKRYGSLLWLLDKTSTSMGARLLKQWMEKPLLNSVEINNRLDAIEYINKDEITRDNAVNLLSNISDIERIANRTSFGNISPKDCVALGKSLEYVDKISDYLRDYKNPLFRYYLDQIINFNELGGLLRTAIKETPHANIHDGGVIADGFDEQLDEYRSIKENSKEILRKLEEKEKEDTGIKNLKISYNRVFGYYIEVSKSQTHLVPYRYIRRQTLTTGERYITEDLKDIESKILNAEEYAKARENLIFERIIEKITELREEILVASKSLAYIDCLFSFAIVASINNFIKPVINNDINHIKIIEGRHPVVEKLLPAGEFVPNDTYLDNEDNRTMLITGPNMAGKSVFMRQVALICIMAQMGCYIPAQSAELPIIDKIFTRVGASDDLSTGRSTFMVEMSEVAFIMKNATNNSLLLMDEIGRGTSTYDGLSIAWAIMDYLSQNLKAKTLFSTHYHELTELEGRLDGVKNYKLSVRELAGSIVFVRKLMRGSANRSFGIEVAQLAGLPEFIIKKAKEILKKLENADIAKREKEKENMNYQLSIFSTGKQSEVSKILKELDIDSISPRTALDILADLKEKLENE